MSRRRATPSSSRTANRWGTPPGLGVAANGARSPPTRPSTRQSASSASEESRATSPVSQDTTLLSLTNDVAASTVASHTFWGDDEPDSPLLPEKHLDASAGPQLYTPPHRSSRPPGLDIPPHLDPNFSPPSQPRTQRKFPSKPCLVVKLDQLPRYATLADVKLAVAEELHADRFEEEAQRARRARMNAGLVNFDVLMELRYSSAQNVGKCFVVLPYGYHGWRLQERGVKVKGKTVRVVPLLGYEPTPQKRLFLQKTPYQDPASLTALQEKKQALSGDIRIRSVEIGSLHKNPRRAFSQEWSKEFTQSPCLLAFDEGLASFRVSYGGHADVDMFSIVVRITSVKSMYYGYEFGRRYIVFHLATSPAFEKGPNVARDTEAQKKDLENIRKRVTYLDEAHRKCAPYAFQLCIEPLDDEGFNDFMRKRLVASMPIGEDLTNVTDPAKELHFTRNEIYGYTNMRKLGLWLEKLDFVLAFQIEALVRNVLVGPPSLLALQHDLDKLMSPKSAYSLSVKSDIIRQFAFLIRKSMPQGVLYSDLDGLRALLKQAEEDNLRLMQRTVAKEAKAIAKHAKKDSVVEERLLPQVVDASAFLCYHVTVTPTAIHLEGPFPVLSNRVLRRYSEHQHCFCRVHFTDEEHNQFRWEREVDGHEFVRERVGGILKNGFELAGRHFDFLAYSFGALKEHTVWFVTPFDWHVTEHGQKLYDGKKPVVHKVNAEYIRTALGDFSKVIRCPSQYGARLSQAFSATYPSIRVAQNEVRLIEDIYDQQDGVRLMSDGCAPMSTQLANDIDAVLMHGKIRGEADPLPRAFQIRIGGSKGMIYADPTLEGRVLCLRPSMNKFDAPDSLDIEVSNVPRASAMYLNRPLVMVLEDLGVRLATFLQLQQDTMDKTLDAAGSIERFRIMISQLKLGSRFNVHYVLGNLADMGFGFHDDCSEDMGILLGDYFFHDLVRSTVWDVFRKIKYQARIRVPDSWTLVGVLDEHQILGPGEVMVYIQDSEYPNGYFLKGKILICRSPVVHPGDVQMVTAVVPPSGSFLDKEPLANCVVFSAQGARSVASALGGGDLDGDLFHVSEYKDLHIVQPYRPAEYQAGEKKTLDRDSTIEDVADFVVEFINSNVLGLVSTTHLIIADQHPDGVRTAKCMKLAELHSNAVDYAKTGIPVAQFRIPHFEFPAKPDWKADEVGDPHSGDFYQSQRALGHLYRRVQLAAVDPTMRVVPAKDSDPVDDIDKLPQPSKTAQEVEDAITLAVRDRIEEHIEKEDLDECEAELSQPIGKKDLDERASPSIEGIFKQYVYELRRICTLHALHINSPLTEMEVMLGTILRKSAQPKRRKELAARMHVHTSQLVGAVTGELMPTNEDGDEKHALLRAWQAWLYVSRLGLEETKRGMEKPFGAKSFGMIALGAIFKLVDRLDQRPAGVDDAGMETGDYDFDFDE